jgi:hypothetical protein
LKPYTGGPDLFLILSPYLMKNNTNGRFASAMKANKVFPHPKPRALYILWPHSGKRAPPTLLKTVLAAAALAAYGVKASTRYVVTGMKEVMTPAPMKPMPMIGAIHITLK